MKTAVPRHGRRGASTPTALGVLFGGQVGGRLVMGAEVAEVDLLRALVRFGHLGRLDVFAPGGTAELDALRASIALPAPAVDARADGGAPTTAPRVRALAELPAALRRERFDAFHTSFMGLAQLAYARERFAAHLFPVTAVVHAIAALDAKAQLLRHVIAGRPSLDVAVCPSQAVRAALLALAREVRSELPAGSGRAVPQPRSVVLPLGVDEERFRPGDRGALRRANGVPQDAVVLLYVGRLSPWNKADLLPLIVALEQVVRASPRRRLLLLLVGQEQQPGYAALLLKAAESLGVADNVEIWTDVPRDELPQVYALADVFVSPVDHLQESFGLTPLEAMACGLPVVASDWDGYSEIVADGETGCLVPVRWGAFDADVTDAEVFLGYRRVGAHLAQTTAVDVSALARHLQRLVSGDELRRRMGAAARARVEAHFTWRRVIAAYEDLWRREVRLAARPRAQPRRPRLFRTHRASTFRTYSPLHVRGDWRVRATRLADALDDGGSGLREIWSHLARQAALDWELAESLCRRAAGPEGTRLDALAGRTRPRERAYATALFLLKHGLLEVA